MNPPPQLPGCLPTGFDRNSFLTVDEFAVWQRKKPATLRRKLFVIPGVRGSGQGVRIHVGTFLDKVK
jgi:hypothetical protein